jgi:hypothetical protein
MVQACGDTSAANKRADAALGVGGSLGGGDAPSGSGGVGGPDAPSLGNGGATGAPDMAPTSGGAPGSGGLATTDGALASGGTTGLVGTGGSVPGRGGGGGSGSGAAIGKGGSSDASDGGQQACSCQGSGSGSSVPTAITMSWDCYCQAYPCDLTLAAYKTDGGYASAVIAVTEYRYCGLVVVTTRAGYDPALTHVFDQATGRLVGDTRGTDTPTPCPFDDTSSYWRLSAGQFPSATCQVTGCTPGGSPLATCGSGGGGGSGTGGSGGSGGAGGATGDGGTPSYCGYECRTDSSGATGWYSGDTRICTADCLGHKATCSYVGGGSEGCYADSTSAGCPPLSSGLIAYGVCSPQPGDTGYLAWQTQGAAGTGPAVVLTTTGTTATRSAGSIKEYGNVAAFPPESSPLSLTAPSHSLTRTQINDLFRRLGSLDLSALPHAPPGTNGCSASLYFRPCTTCAATTLNYGSSESLTPEMEPIWAWFDSVLEADHAANPRNYCMTVGADR